MKEIALFLLEKYNKDLIKAEILLPKKISDTMGPSFAIQILNQKILLNRTAAEGLLAKPRTPKSMKDLLNTRVLPITEEQEQQLSGYARDKISEANFSPIHRDFFARREGVAHSTINALALNNLSFGF